MELSKEGKLDENNILSPQLSSVVVEFNLSLTDARKILDPFTKDQLFDVFQFALLLHVDVLYAVRSIADCDPARQYNYGGESCDGGCCRCWCCCGCRLTVAWLGMPSRLSMLYGSQPNQVGLGLGGYSDSAHYSLSGGSGYQSQHPQMAKASLAIRVPHSGRGRSRVGG